MFKKIYLEITNRCNLACPFCQPTNRAAAVMPVAVFVQVLDRLKGNTRHLCLHVLGEPLLHPRLPELLDLAHGAGFRINLTTNGTLLHRHAQALLSAPALRQVAISLHSLAQLESDAAKAVVDTAVDFARQAGASGRLWVSLRLWNLGDALDESARAWNAWLLGLLSATFSRPELARADLTAARGIVLAPGIFLNPERQFAWPDPLAPELARRGYCRGLRDHLAVLVDGTVVPCCLDGDGALALGNLLQQPLTEILASPRAQRMRAGFGHQWLVEPLCRRCAYRLRFAPSRMTGCLEESPRHGR